jgi:hypothetical protein
MYPTLWLPELLIQLPLKSERVLSSLYAHIKDHFIITYDYFKLASDLFVPVMP